MTRPVVNVSIAFGTPTGAPTWTDVTSYVRGLSIHRGRQFELDRVEAGTCQVVLDNLDRRFDLTNTAGPYYGNIKPGRRIRIQSTWDGVTYPMFYGYIEGWPLAWPGQTDAIIQVPAADGMKLLAGQKFSREFPEQSTADRVALILSGAGWTLGSTWCLGAAASSTLPDGGGLNGSTILGPNGEFSTDSTCKGVIQAEEYSKIDALSMLTDALSVENGNMYIARDGVFTFKSRWHRNEDTSAVPVIGDDLASLELPYLDIKPVYDDSRIINDVEITTDEGDESTASDDTSLMDYGRRSYTLASAPYGGALAATEAAAWATYLIARYKDPRLRFESVQLSPHRDEEFWATILSTEIGRRIEIKRRPTGGAGIIDQVCHVEGIEIQIVPGDLWRVVWNLSPEDPTDYWILETRSVLDSSTVLAY